MQAGEVVGVNSMIFGGDLSVAVPSNVVVEWLARAGKRVYLGVGVRPVRINPTQEDEQPVAGVLVIQVDPQGACGEGRRSGWRHSACRGRPAGDRHGNAEESACARRRGWESGTCDNSKRQAVDA